MAPMGSWTSILAHLEVTLFDKIRKCGLVGESASLAVLHFEVSKGAF